jgi:hypothetical protein
VPQTLQSVYEATHSRIEAAQPLLVWPLGQLRHFLVSSQEDLRSVHCQQETRKQLISVR